MSVSVYLYFNWILSLCCIYCLTEFMRPTSSFCSGPISSSLSTYYTPNSLIIWWRYCNLCYPCSFTLGFLHIVFHKLHSFIICRIYSFVTFTTYFIPTIFLWHHNSVSKVLPSAFCTEERFHIHTLQCSTHKFQESLSHIPLQ